MEIIVLPTAVGVFECALPRVWDTLGLCVGSARSRGGKGQGAGPSHNHFPHNHSHSGAKRTVPAVPGQEVLVRCPCPPSSVIFAKCPGNVETTWNCIPGRLLWEQQCPEGWTGAQEDADCRWGSFSLAVCDWLALVPVCSSQPWSLCSSSPTWPAFALTHSHLLFYSGLGITWFMDKLLLGLTSHLAMQEPPLLFFLKKMLLLTTLSYTSSSGVQVPLGGFYLLKTSVFLYMQMLSINLSVKMTDCSVWKQ